jgi:hypothetical protein
VLFEQDDEARTIADHCEKLVGDGSGGDVAWLREDCRLALVDLVEERRRAAREAAEREKTQRKHCALRFPRGVDLGELGEAFVERAGGSFSRAMKDLRLTLFPDMDALGWEVGTDKITHHGYHRFYDKYFDEQTRSRAGLKLLEIGLARGSSMNLWCGFFPTAEIVGVDVTLHPDCQPCSLGDGIYVFSGDSGDAELLRRLHREGDDQYEARPTARAK